MTLLVVFILVAKFYNPNHHMLIFSSLFNPSPRSPDLSMSLLNFLHNYFSIFYICSGVSATLVGSYLRICSPKGPCPHNLLLTSNSVRMQAWVASKASCLTAEAHVSEIGLER